MDFDYTTEVLFNHFSVLQVDSLPESEQVSFLCTDNQSYCQTDKSDSKGTNMIGPTYKGTDHTEMAQMINTSTSNINNSPSQNGYTKDAHVEDIDQFDANILIENYLSTVGSISDLTGSTLLAFDVGNMCNNIDHAEGVGLTPFNTSIVALLEHVRELNKVLNDG